MSGHSNFLGRSQTQTTGFNQPYLGPTVVMREGGLAATVRNTLNAAVTAHWHGLLVPGEHDGGPHLPIPPGGLWDPDMFIAQPPATAWYHTHIHGQTANQVHSGLAGVIHLTDGRDDQRGIPSAYGVDDLTLVLQDRRFNGSGRMVYDLHMMDIMHGFTGDTMMVNGQVEAVAAVPKGIVRLRLVNGSNARIYLLYFDDARTMHLIATDGGYLDSPIALDKVRLAPGERVELLVDFSTGGNPVLMSEGDPNQGPAGMMGRMRGLIDTLIDRSFPVLSFSRDESLPARIASVPEEIGGSLPNLEVSPTTSRHFSLDMSGGGMTGRGMMGKRGGGMMSGLAINGRPFDMERIDLKIAHGTVERWVVSSTMLSHPFHIHGALFQVIAENGGSPRPESTGWKDTVLVEDQTEILVRFDMPASRTTPFMYHCHILEHEDAGMMGQFTVS
ncbi:MAG: multicopper oxidase domain-containing protein [Alphaproteobacteria bacterium]|nr:multicopper oxidase domain-containing protein [Alphaproteobacteria bacterium]